MNNEEKLKTAIELLRSVRPFLNDHSGFSITTAMYVTPAQRMREQADEMEREEALVRSVDKFLSEI